MNDDDDTKHSTREFNKTITYRRGTAQRSMSIENRAKLILGYMAIYNNSM